MLLKLLLRLIVLILNVHNGGYEMITNEISNLHSSIITMPTSMLEAVEQKKKFGEGSRYIAGTTLLQIQWDGGQSIPPHLISIEKIKELREVKLVEQDTVLSIGALTSLASCRQQPLLKVASPELSEAVKYIAAPAVRTRGTVGGNIMGGVGDLIPLFLALKAQMVVLHDSKEEKVEMWEWFKCEKKEDVLLTSILIPYEAVQTNKHSFFKKLGRREAFTAATVTVSGYVSWTELGVIEEVRLAIGGGGNKPIRLTQTEELMIGKKLIDIDWKAIYKSILAEFSPPSDPFVTAVYRKKTSANLIIAELQSSFSSFFNSKEGSYEV